VAALIAVTRAAPGRLPVAAVVKADITEAVTAAMFAVEVAAAAAGVDRGRFAAAAIVVVLDGKATSAFPDKSIQKLFASLRVDRSALPRNWHGMKLGETFGWQEGAA
jgi:uncharacterized Ntn-hydrolase superfamily protein